MERRADTMHLGLPDGRVLHARLWPGRGRPLVLLHGLLDDAEGWRDVAATTHRPCVALDLPGFGGSSLPARPLISAYAEAVAAGLDELGVEQCTLVGHSLGGAVATAVAEHSGAVRSLALLAPAGFGPIRLAEVFARRGVVDLAQLALPLGLVNPLTVTAAYATFVAHRRLPPADLVHRLRRRAFSAGPGVRTAVEAIAAAGRSPDGFSHRRIAFDGPVAALWGERDALVPLEHVEALAGALPQAHVAVWEGMGHHPQRERPQQLARFIEHRAARARRPRWCGDAARAARARATLPRAA